MMLYRYLCLPVCPALCVHAVARALPCCFGLPNTRVSQCFLSRFTVASVHCRNESIGRRPVSRVVQRTLEKYVALSVGVDSLSRVINQIGNLKLYVQGPLLWYASEFMSEYPEENPNIVWSGWKHLETYE